MITIAVPAEGAKDERRVALSPETAKKFAGLGCEVRIQSGAGTGSQFADKDYRDAGAKIARTAAETLKGAHIVLTVGRPAASALKDAGKDTVLAGLLDPYGDKQELTALAKSGVAAFSMELMPRITRAQAMDVLSSQANLAGYKAVVDAAARFGRAMPMMMTAAGTVPAARVFVMGAGVAGLQAIATARRLGAIVTATDVRPAAKEQVESLGAKFVAVEDAEFRKAETAGGYAKEMSAAYKKKQVRLVADHIKTQDIVVTTALIPGRPAPELISREMVESMRPGAIVADLAAERGGNCALTRPGETVEHKGVAIMGPVNLAGEIAANASSLYARNLFSFIALMINQENMAMAIDWEDEIIKSALIARGGKLVHPVLTSKSGAGKGGGASKSGRSAASAKGGGTSRSRKTGAGKSAGSGKSGSGSGTGKSAAAAKASATGRSRKTGAGRQGGSGKSGASGKGGKM